MQSALSEVVCPMPVAQKRCILELCLLQNTRKPLAGSLTNLPVTRSGCTCLKAKNFVVIMLKIKQDRAMVTMKRE